MTLKYSDFPEHKAHIQGLHTRLFDHRNFFGVDVKSDIYRNYVTNFNKNVYSYSSIAFCYEWGEKLCLKTCFNFYLQNVKMCQEFFKFNKINNKKSYIYIYNINHRLYINLCEYAPNSVHCAVQVHVSEGERRIPQTGPLDSTSIKTRTTTNVTNTFLKRDRRYLSRWVS